VRWPNVKEMVDGSLSDMLERGESGLDLVAIGEAVTGAEMRGLPVNLLLLPLGKPRGRWARTECRRCYEESS